MNGLSVIARSASRAAVSSKSSRMMSTKLSVDSINQHLVKAEYAVRGELVIKADGYRKQLVSQPGSLPFKKIYACNIGNPHELGQKPLTFFRQVISLVHYPALMEGPAAAAFPADAIARAKAYLSTISTTGAYTHSKGLTMVRDEIAAFVGERDGYPTDPENLFVTDGASAGVKQLLQTLITKPTDGVLCPIPQYPLYSATMTLLDGKLVGYFLNESNGWTLEIPELERSLAEAKANGVDVRSIVIINPGNPTGQCLTEENIREVVTFCEKNGLVLLADEVYQTNIYSTVPFTSFRKVVKDMGSKVRSYSLSCCSLGSNIKKTLYFYSALLASATLPLFRL